MIELLLKAFENYLLLTLKGTKRKKFPRKEAMIFVSELKEYLFYCKKQFVCDIGRVEKLMHALQIMAPYCKNHDGIEAFKEVLRTLIEGIELIKRLQNLQLSEEQPYFCFTTHLLRPYNLESVICMDEPVLTTGVENLEDADAFESKCEIEEVSSRERIATEKLQLLNSLIGNQEFKFIEDASLDFSPSTGDPSFTVFVNNQECGVTEVCDVRSILTGYDLQVKDYVYPTELSLLNRHRDPTELSLALSYRRLFSCCQWVFSTIVFELNIYI